MTDKYILRDGQPVPCNDLLEWGRWMQTADRHVANTMVGEVRISTVFLGLDHAFGGSVPILYETMIFGGPHDQYQDRYTNHDDAVAGHARAVKLARQS